MTRTTFTSSGRRSSTSCHRWAGALRLIRLFRISLRQNFSGRFLVATGRVDTAEQDLIVEDHVLVERVQIDLEG